MTALARLAPSPFASVKSFRRRARVASDESGGVSTAQYQRLHRTARTY
jgi:hypothetical protein